MESDKPVFSWKEGIIPEIFVLYEDDGDGAVRPTRFYVQKASDGLFWVKHKEVPSTRRFPFEVAKQHAEDARSEFFKVDAIVSESRETKPRKSKKSVGLER